jgi:hypothetical protein
MAQTQKCIAGYVQPVGAKLETLWDVSGPTSYANTATFATSGQTCLTGDFGLGGVETVFAQSLSNDGLYTCLILLVAQSVNAGASKSFVIHWFVQATGAEVANAVDLSASFFRLRIRGV